MLIQCIDPYFERNVRNFFKFFLVQLQNKGGQNKGRCTVDKKFVIPRKNLFGLQKLSPLTKKLWLQKLLTQKCQS